jgi:hypothetical protein
LLKHQGVRPEAIVTDKLASHGAAVKELGLSDRHEPAGLPTNNRAGNSHLLARRRERKQQELKSQGSAYVSFLHEAVSNTFEHSAQLISRPGLRILRAQAHEVWANATAAAYRRSVADNQQYRIQCDGVSLDNLILPIQMRCSLVRTVRPFDYRRHFLKAIRLCEIPRKRVD